MASGNKNPERKNMIMLGCDRMAFGGPQVPSDLLLGGYVIYTCVDGPFNLTIGDASGCQHYIAIVPPYTRHSVVGPSSLRSILVEAETVPPDIVDDEQFKSGSPSARALAQRIEQGFRRWAAGEFRSPDGSFDLFFFGEALRRRELDPRIAFILDRVDSVQCGVRSGIGALAREVSLSPSRLRHLFGEQVGVSIRSYRSWKRARNALYLALKESDLMQLAMAAGYADSTHLCHSVKLYFGERPTFVWTHWRSADFLQIGMRDQAALTESVDDMPGRCFGGWKNDPALAFAESQSRRGPTARARHNGQESISGR